MKGIKRLACFAVLTLLLISAAVPAGAASNTDAILASLRQGVAVNGKTVEFPASYINQAENYFASHQLSDAQVQYILAEINGAKAAIRDSGATDLKKLDRDTKQKILSAAQAAADEVDLKMTVGSDKKVKIADSGGTVVFTDENPIKTTGAALNWGAVFAAGASFLALLGVCFGLIGRYGLLEMKRR